MNARCWRLLTPLILLTVLSGCLETPAPTAAQAVKAGACDTHFGIVHLTREGAREIVVQLPENQRNQASPRALVFPFDAPEQAVTATLRELPASVDPFTHTYSARYVLHGAVGRFNPGSTLAVRLQSNRQNP
ncbi:hypothetical protein HX787_12640 [Pseudomonas tolaasii]|uniref:CusB-like beta-barrel domain-containing protein n=1 Tax=Pseudomonas tolaasii TaxID=29442 RepID=A0A7Y8AM50_PSETO|nr:hypothetical protein B5P22_27500 [Pseudomonas tolaasii]KAB0470738.1 hypothetical protein F7R12_17555 [Pseudomonas tolaasii]MBY8939595.1 hypothetical protein [Pseudomonas tolaasii]NWC19253.1 hypothetical protein [Pseudomonas tolaasii]NWC41917.1 hypothetical protein [Pseudomonas tolaasii]